MKMKKNPKKAVSPILKAAALVIIISALGTCKALTDLVSEPAVSFDSVSITGLSFTKADMKARIKVRNDNAVTIPFPEINWKLFVSDTPFLNGTIEDDTEIAASQSTIVDIPFDVLYTGLFETIASVINDYEAPYRIDLAVIFNIPLLGSETFNASHKGSIPLPKVPDLSFSDINFDYDIFPPKGEFDMTLRVDNKNIFALNLDKLNYNFKVNNSIWVLGAAPQNTSLPARSQTLIPVTTNVHPLAVIGDIITIAATGSTVNYTCNGDISLSPQGFASFTTLEDHPFEFLGNTILKK